MKHTARIQDVPDDPKRDPPAALIGHRPYGTHYPFRADFSKKDEEGAMVNKPIAKGRQSSQLLRERPCRLRALIVEDEAIIAMELEMLLDELEADVVGIAMSAAEAEIFVKASRPDFVTMDIDIQGDRDGISAAVDLFEKYGVRSIFVSANSDVAMRKRAEPCNAIGWVGKPIDKADLAEVLGRVKGHRN